MASLTASFNAWTLAAVVAAQIAQAPAFKSGVELVVVDVQVVDSHGYPIETLTPEGFTVTIDGHRRRVVSAELTKYAGRTTTTAADPAPAPLGLAASPKTSRMFIIAVDESSFTPLHARSAMIAAGQFIDRLEPEDYVGVYAYPTGALQVDLTRNHERVKKDLEHITGLLDVPYSKYRTSVSEVLDISAGDAQVWNQVVARECAFDKLSFCKPALQMEIDAKSQYFEMQAVTSLGALMNIIQSCGAVPGRKTLVVVSGGLLVSDRGGGRPNIGLETYAFSHEAAASGVNMYVLHMDNAFMDAYSGTTSLLQSQMREAGASSLGLELVAGATGGSLVHVEGSMPERAFDRVERETSAYYLLGVEPADADRDGKTHNIKVAVSEHGASVRSRTLVMIPAAAK